MKIKEMLNSVNFKIWSMVMGVLLLFIASIILINILFLRHSENSFIYKQLQEASEAKRIMNGENNGKNEENNNKQGDSYSSLTSSFINHFSLVEDNKGYHIDANELVRKIYFDKNGNSEILETISNKIIEGIKDGTLEVQGKITINNTIHYYYVDYTSTYSQTIFLTSITKETAFPIQYFIVLIIILIVSFIGSNKVTKRIVQPIKELECFAKEVALHHWDATPPTPDTTEIKQLAKSLNQMKDTLRTTEERERRFLQSSSHNLKTPVMVIKGYAQALIDGITIDSKNSAAQVIRSEAECLERRIIQLLKLNTYGHALEKDKLQDYIRLDRLIKSLVNNFKLIRPELNWSLDLFELEIIGNSDAILTAFENLLENQLRFANTTIAIQMKKGSTIDISISNDGEAFMTDNPMNLFDRYKKDKEGNFGLGLAIVKQVIEAHGGQVEAANLDNGVVFKVSLPTSILSNE